MNRSSQHRFVLALAAFTAGALLAAMLVHWSELSRGYCLLRLRGRPSLLEEMLLAGGSREAAARRFVEESAGKQALMELYMAEFDRNQPDWKNRDYLLRLMATAKADRKTAKAERNDGTQGRVDAQVSLTLQGSLTLWASGFSVQHSTGSGGSGSSMGCSPLNPRRRELVLSLIHLCEGKTFEVPDFEGFQFQLQPFRDGQPLEPRWPDRSTPSRAPPPMMSPGLRHVCYFRVLEQSGASRGGGEK